ncbi:MAG: ATP-binding protein [Phenylobacterium sp.]
MTKLKQERGIPMERKNQKSFITTDDRLDKIKLEDASVRDVAEAFYYGNDSYNYNLDVLVSGFFNKSSINKYETNFSKYKHTVLQITMPDFLASLGFQKTGEYNPSHGNKIAKATKESKDIEGIIYQFYDKGLILYNHTQDKNRKLIIEISSWYDKTGYDYSIYCNYDIDNNILLNWENYTKANNPYRGKKIDGSGEILKLNENISFDSIVLPDKMLKIIKDNTLKFFGTTALLSQNNVNLKRGIILSGPPGNGKTMICKALANEVNVSVLYVLPSNLQQTTDVNRIYEMAIELSPCLLIIEDIDFMTMDRDNFSGDGRLIELMNKLDGIEEMNGVITLATTNLVDKVETAIKNRPGRFDRVINIPLPDIDLRIEMFKKFLNNADVDYEVVAEKAEKLSGAYIKEICQTAKLLAIVNGDIDSNNLAIVNDDYLLEAITEMSDKDFSQAKKYIPKNKIGFEVSRIER